MHIFQLIRIQLFKWLIFLTQYIGYQVNLIIIRL